jgi:glycosyltransferase involved in cell wall biosynthesis
MPVNPSPRLHVLFVVDSRYWITAVEAREIIKHNPHIRGVLCSVPLLDELLRRAPYLAENVDLVHFLVPVAGRRYLDRFLGKLPCVATIHHIEPGYHPEAVPVNAKADSIMVVAETWRSDLVLRGVPLDRIVIVPNGVDTGVFRPATASERLELRHSMGFASDETVIGFSGQPGRDAGWRKGLDIFLQALKILAERENRVATVVGGPGWETALAKIRDMGIKAYWRRFTPNVEDVAPMYRALDFYWVTSRIEGGPVPLLEAMSSGVCCISTKVGVAPEVIKDGTNGYLVDVEDAPQIASLTGKLIEQVEERERMGREARSSVLCAYDWSQTTKRALLLYDTAVTGFKRRFPAASERKMPLAGDNDLRSSPMVRMCDGDGAILLSRDARWLEVQEQLAWSGALCRMGERRAALREGWRACLVSPFSKGTYDFLVALLLPRRAFELARVLRDRRRSSKGPKGVAF